MSESPPLSELALRLPPFLYSHSYTASVFMYIRPVCTSCTLVSTLFLTDQRILQLDFFFPAPVIITDIRDQSGGLCTTLQSTFLQSRFSFLSRTSRRAPSSQPLPQRDRGTANGKQTRMGAFCADGIPAPPYNTSRHHQPPASVSHSLHQPTPGDQYQESARSHDA